MQPTRGGWPIKGTARYSQLKEGWCKLLVLSRHKNESVVIDPWSAFADQLRKLAELDVPLGILRAELRSAAALLAAEKPIEAHVVEIRGDKVRIGWEAPKSTLVHRMEVWNEVQRQKKGGTDA